MDLSVGAIQSPAAECLVHRAEGLRLHLVAAGSSFECWSEPLPLPLHQDLRMQSLELAVFVKEQFIREFVASPGANVRMDSSSTVDLHIEYVLPRHTGKEVGNDEISPKTSTVANMSVGEFVAMDGECQVSWRNQPLVHSECLPMPLDALHAKSSDRSPLRSTHTLWGSQYNGHGSFSRHDTMSASAGSAGGVICAERTSSMGNSSCSKAAGESFASIPEAERLSWSASMLSDRKIATPESWWKVKRCSKTYILSKYFYISYVLYLGIMTVLAAVALRWGPTAIPLTWRNALYMATSVSTVCGLSPLDFSMTGKWTQAVLWTEMVLCSPVLLSLAPLVLRCRSFERQLRYERRQGSTLSRHISGGVVTNIEEQALRYIMKVVTLYWFLCQFVGWLLLWLCLAVWRGGYGSAGAGAILSSAWPSLFLSMSAFHNLGLHTLKGLPSEQEPQVVSLSMLATLMVLVVAGNSGFPVILRGILVLRRYCQSGNSEVLDFLLAHPRRVYTHLFPDYATRWLALVFLIFPMLLFAAIMTAADFNVAWMKDWPPAYAAMRFLFFCISARDGGFTVGQPLGGMTPSIAYVLCVSMWVSPSPVVVAIRSTQESQIGACIGVAEYDLSGEHKRSEVDVRSVKGQLSRFLDEYRSIILVLLFIILHAEQDKLLEYEYAMPEPSESSTVTTTAPVMPTGQNGQRITFLKILFECSSAYGTVGLSMSSAPWSLSGEWSWTAQCCLLVLMFLGRLRGLPNSIDPSVSFFWKNKIGNSVHVSAPRAHPVETAGSDSSIEIAAFRRLG